MTDRRYMYAEAVAILAAAEAEDDRGAPQACQAEASVKDPYAGKPWGEQQEQVDWLESRYDDQYEGENDYYGSWDE